MAFTESDIDYGIYDIPCGWRRTCKGCGATWTDSFSNEAGRRPDTCRHVVHFQEWDGAVVEVHAHLGEDGKAVLMYEDGTVHMVSPDYVDVHARNYWGFSRGWWH